ncbi:MAG: flagellar hook-length control protein FliK [Bacteroidales bacterium]|nr:flagellar hook-length control protein FliK [Clostridium sp.]MCM1203050.1 flagellar hook-length control protein FliK [Bacteroidales bacterium]
MQIGHQMIKGYDSHIQESAKSDAAKGAEQSAQVKSSSDLAGLKEGAVFRGEVLDIAGEKITIALENRAQLLARLQEGVDLGVGDRLLFSVKENTASQILIKPLFDSLYSAQTQVLEKALDAAGLSPTEKNFSAAKELMEAGMPLDKGNLVKLLSQSMKFEGTSMQTLAALNKMNIPVTQENIAQFERYQEYNHQLTGDITRTADGMASFVEAFPQDTPGSTLLSLTGELLDIFTVQESENAEAAGSPKQAEEMPAADETAKAVAEGEEAQGKAAEGKVPEGKTAEQAVQENTGIEQGKAEGKQEEASRFLEKTGLSREEAANLSEALQKAGIPEEQIQHIRRQAGSGEELLKAVTQALANSEVSDEAVRSMLESGEFKKLFSDMVKKSWMLNPKEMKDPKEIDELYNKMLKQSRAFEEAVSSKGGNTKNFNQNFQNMRQNMQFMEQLNHQMIYAQMPLKLSNQNANSELFVYADKRKLMEKKDGISVMLHLDMDNLGMTDIKVTLTGTNVNARFYLNDQQSVDIVADNMPQLAKQLADRGFSLTNEVVKRQPQESINKVVDEIIDENAERSIKRYTFDARM